MTTMTAMRVLVTGGGGYMGHVLVPYLLAAGRRVTVLDTFWYGDRLIPSYGLSKVKGDIRDPATVRGAMVGQDAVIHLACISNDPSVELDEALSRTINFEAFEPLVKAAKDAGVKRFIYCSSSSVYGISDAPEVREDHPLMPITLYNRYKGECEPLLFKHQSDDFTCVVIRPSTHCGYSPRMRLDLAVNILTHQAVNKSLITVFGGAQKRPNVHINDMAETYLTLLDVPASYIAGETFNVGAKNMTIADLAILVQENVQDEFSRPVQIEVKKIADERSYHVNSDKIAKVLGLTPKWTVGQAVRDICEAFRSGKIPDPMDDRYYNVTTMKGIYNAGVLSELDVHRGADAAAV